MIVGLTGNHVIVTNGGNDRVCGGSGGDVIEAASETSSDTVYLSGGRGGDELAGDVSNDIMLGGPGVDFIDAIEDNGTDQDRVNGGPGTDNRSWDEGDVAENCEV